MNIQIENSGIVADTWSEIKNSINNIEIFYSNLKNGETPKKHEPANTATNKTKVWIDP